MSQGDLREIEHRLNAVSGELNEIARLIRRADLDSKANVRIIGEAIASISEVRNSIYRVEPALTPDYLRTGKPEEE